MKRTRDEIGIAGKTPYLSVGSQIVLRVSPDDLLKGEPRDAFLWEPDKCVQGARARISELLPGSNHCTRTTREDNNFPGGVGTGNASGDCARFCRGLSFVRKEQ
jgi:hypothetical protein